MHHAILIWIFASHAVAVPVLGPIAEEPAHVAGKHPCLSKEQEWFEANHENATRTMNFRWRTARGRKVHMSLRISQRSGEDEEHQFSKTMDYIQALDGQTLFSSDVVLDVGASVGAFAVAIALHFPRARIIAIEPAPQNFRYLLWNIRLNNVSRRVWPMNIAVRGPSEDVVLELKYSPIWWTASSQCPLEVQEDCEFQKYDIPAVTLMNLLELFSLSRVRWLKLDCEGCEWQAGIDPLFLPMVRSFVELLSVEVHPWEAPPGERSAALINAVCPKEIVRDELLTSSAKQVGRAQMCSRAFAVPPSWRQDLQTSPKSHPRDGAELAAADVRLDHRTLSRNTTEENTPQERRNSREPMTLEQPTRSMGAKVSVAGVLEDGAIRGNIFLLSSFSHDDVDQWGLMPHFFAHYQGVLKIEPDHFLLILHSDSRNQTGLQYMAKGLQEQYGVVYSVLITEPYSSVGHMKIKIHMLQQHVKNEDWVVQVDADEFAFFPGGGTAREALDALAAERENVHYGLMVDRVASNGEINTPVSGAPSIFSQFPRKCALTLLIQNSDFRKVTAYRGFLRTSSGNHNVIGLNATAAVYVANDPNETPRLINIVRNVLGSEAFEAMPYANMGFLPKIRPTLRFATVYHFKWVRGLYKKLMRRAETEVTTKAQYGDIRTMLDHGSILKDEWLRTLCSASLDTDPNSSVGPLTSRELFGLFVQLKVDQLDDQFKKQGFHGQDVERPIAWILQRNINLNMARDTDLPVH